MTVNKAYWAGYEDGFAGKVCNTIGLANRDIYTYIWGFNQGSQARRNSCRCTI